MLDFLMQNLGTIIVALVVVIVIALVIIKMVKDRKAGKTSCGCGCKDCPSKEMCHK